MICVMSFHYCSNTVMQRKQCSSRIAVEVEALQGQTTEILPKKQARNTAHEKAQSQITPSRIPSQQTQSYCQTFPPPVSLLLYYKALISWHCKERIDLASA
jgi:hypothetical protein